MPDSDSTKNQHAWRSKFRSRSHEQAHDQEHEHQPIQCDHAAVFTGKPDLIATPEALADLIARLRAAGSFAYDSEFIGELSYVPKLCLIQIATEKEIALVDPLALDLTPLWELLADPSVEKVVHAGPQDMEPVTRLLGRPAANVVDTQIAAGFAFLPYPISLQRLVLQMLGVKLGKGLTFTHWDQRPLSAQQIRYAADDVRYLPATWAELRKRVESAGTLAQVSDECRAMCDCSPYQFDRETSYFKVRGAGSLDPRQLGVLRELAAWRNDEAKKADLPPRTFLRDEILIDICRRCPATLEKLQNIQGLPRPVRTNSAQDILSVIAAGRENPVNNGGESRKSDEMPEEQFRNDGLFALAQTIAISSGIDPQIVMTRSDIAELTQAIARKKPLAKLRLMQGWRKELLGDKLLSLIQSGGNIHLQLPQSR